MPNQGQYDRIDESSPLIAAQNKEDDDDIEARRLSDTPSASEHEVHLDDSYVETKSTWYLILLTFSIGGLQIVWSVELSHGSPYLLSLGMSKALLAFVWLAGPMTGVLVQPYVGMLSDRCRISWGKRKPFMIGGAIGTVAASLLLAYARQIVRVIGRWSVDDPYDGYWQGITIAFATIMMWVLDFSINAVQAAIRAFIVDGAPAHQQEAANAWASRIVGVGNVLGYIFGYLDLPKYFSFLGKEQFQVLCAIASIALCSTVFVSIVSVKERNPKDEPLSRDNYQTGLISFFKQVWNSIKRLPPPIRRVCEIQFFNWMGWFPFLFYITTYIGQLYVNPSLEPDMPSEDVDELWGKATRVGTLALLIYAIVSFASNVLLPFLIVPTYKAVDHVEPVAPTSPIGTRAPNVAYADETHARAVPVRQASFLSEGMTMSADLGPRPSFVQRTLKKIQVPGLTLRRAWMLSQLLYSLCMFSTFFISTPQAATAMVAVVGVAWSLTLWAPFALISAEISKRDEARRHRQRRKLLSGNAQSFYDTEEDQEDRAGIILGLHNVAVSAPQVIATLVSSAVFKILQKPRNEPGDVSVAWTLRLGGIAVLASAFLTWRMRESVAEDEADT